MESKEDREKREYYINYLEAQKDVYGWVGVASYGIMIVAFLFLAFGGVK